jgi:hypothetical protein
LCRWHPAATDTKERGDVGEASATLELTGGVQERVRELRALSEKAEGGDKEARRELRRAVRESTPEVISRCSDIARTYRKFLAKTASGKDPLVEEAFVRRAEMIAVEVAGESPSVLEVLLAERIASLWALTELQEALISAYYGGATKNLPPSYILQMAKLQESAGRRYLAAIKTLAQVRKAQVGTPALQLTQINVS